MKLKHKFVDYIPDIIKDGILYISLDYGTVIHKCVCGCGNEVNTPLTPNDWKMTYNGEDITLKPSIGNWSFECKSHYWITNNEIEWSVKWSKNEIQQVREFENSERQDYYQNKKSKVLDTLDNKEQTIPKTTKVKKSWFKRLFVWVLLE